VGKHHELDTVAKNFNTSGTGRRLRAGNFQDPLAFSNVPLKRRPQATLAPSLGSGDLF
jgi:hypothetical protein